MPLLRENLLLTLYRSRSSLTVSKCCYLPPSSCTGLLSQAAKSGLLYSPCCTCVLPGPTSGYDTTMREAVTDMHHARRFCYALSSLSHKQANRRHTVIFPSSETFGLEVVRLVSMLGCSKIGCMQRERVSQARLERQSMFRDGQF